MKDLHGPQTQVFEGAYAIKVSMSCSGKRRWLLYLRKNARTTVSLVYHVLHSTSNITDLVAVDIQPPTSNYIKRNSPFLSTIWLSRVLPRM